MKRVINTIRIARYWWHEFRWYRRTTWRDGFKITTLNCARRAWSDTQRNAYYKEDGIVWFLPF